MSDIADVLNVLVSLAEGAVYPNGVNNPSITASPIKIYPGWPTSDALDTDLAAGKANVSVFPKTEERNTTRYREKCLVITPPLATLTLTIEPGTGGVLQLEGGGNLLLEGGGLLSLEGNNLVVTVGGTVSVPQNVMMRVNGKDYVYSVQPADTLVSVAASLAALVVVDVAGTFGVGPSINIGAGGRVQAARVGGFGTVTREIRRQERVVMLTVWAATPALRDQIAAAIDVALAALRFITMPDGYGARIIYKNSLVVDALQKAALYRRDLNYSVEFATTVSKQAAAVIAPKIALQVGSETVNVTA